MTRRDYVFLADSCKAALEAARLADNASPAGRHVEGAAIAVRVLANRLHSANANFDTTRFLVASGLAP